MIIAKPGSARWNFRHRPWLAVRTASSHIETIAPMPCLDLGQSVETLERGMAVNRHLENNFQLARFLHSSLQDAAPALETWRSARGI
jgi:O-acetylhomoserine/O-acetylserine sulfhydrylase-like pyridoxal-dependent enzyme